MERADCKVSLHDGVHSYLEANPVFDLCGVRTIGEAAVVTDESRTTLIAGPAWDAVRLRTHARCEVVACDDVATALGARLSGRVAVAGLDCVSARFRAALAHCELVELPPAGPQRAKTPTELAAARRAAALAEAAYAELLRGLRPGISETELIARLDVDVRRRGADDHFVLSSSSPNGDNVRSPTDRLIVAGDVINVEISPAVDGQFVQICRTAVVGPASAARQRDYELLTAAFRAGAAAARPGARVSDVVAALDEPLFAAGLGEYCRPPHIRVRGHGQGLASLAPGDITFDNKTRLELGMMFTLHPNQRFPAERGYMLCGEPILVTSDGGEPLTGRVAALDEC